MSPSVPDNDGDDHDRTQQQIIVRFASSQPDLALAVPDPKHKIVLHLKLLIRDYLASEVDAQSGSSSGSSKSRLNLICAGKLLRNDEVVSSALRLRSSPSPSAAVTLSPPPPPKKGTVKGKEPAVHAQRTVSTKSQTAGPPLYIHCSLGEDLSAQELQEEVAQASTAEFALQRGTYGIRPAGTADQVFGAPRQQHAVSQQQQQQPPPAVGFDRLLGSGWTPDDVVSLRASFLAHLSYSHTASTMPTGDALRLLEERWLDSTGPGGSRAVADTDAADGLALAVTDTEGAVALQQFDDDEAGMLDDALWGSVVGFFWPWAAVWRLHEEDLWTERRNVMVLLGLVVNVVFGLMRLVTSREDSF